MTKSRESELTTDLMRAQIRLGMIARMATLNLEQAPKEHEFAEVMQTILAACGIDKEH
jgi:hypothetical protein